MILNEISTYLCIYYPNSKIMLHISTPTNYYLLFEYYKITKLHLSAINSNNFPQC